MATDWKYQTVDDHTSGITDLITSATPDFQEICNNLDSNVKMEVLSTRAGYLHWTDQLTPTKIQQLFKLEDWIVAYCYDDPDPEDLDEPISGKLYYRLETDQTSAWSEVVTPKERTTATIFRIYDSLNKGFTLRKTAPTVDNWVVKDGSNPGSLPVISYDGRTVIVTVDVTKLTSDFRYDTGGAVYLKWSFFTSAFAGGYTATRFSGTLSTEEVHFDEILEVQTNPSDLLGIYPANARSDGDGVTIPYIDEQGHLSQSDWQSHLYQALEPYVKTYTPNPLDPYGKDPDTYPPDNNRLPLRKIAPIATPIGISPAGYELKGFNAQLPKSFIGIDLSASEPDIYTDAFANARYQCWELRWDYSSPTYLGETTATIKIWCERSWGQVGASGVMPDASYLRYETFDAKDPIDDALPFALADYAVAGVSPYSGIAGGIDWGKLFLVYHQRDPANVQIVKLSYVATVEAIQAAFEEYQKRFVTISGTDYYASYQQFGFYIQENPQARRVENLNVLDCFLSVTYHDNLPEDVPGNHQYGYAFYLRDSYEASFEGSPRQFIFDGPTSFVATRTLSKIGLPPIKAFTDATKSVEVLFSTAPQIYGGLAARMLRQTDLYFQSTMDGIFARTTDGGDVYYIDQTTKYWLRTADIDPPVLPQDLVDDNWKVSTAYVIPSQSETTDEALIFNEGAYFNGGVLSYDSLPQGPYYFGITNQVGYYVDIVNNIQRVYQSTPGVPHASPATLFSDFDDETTGFAQFMDKAIIFTQARTWRMEGVRSSDGTGKTFLRTVSDEFGCVAHQSIVTTNLGIFYWSNSGVIYSDGLRAVRVSEHLITRYTDWLSIVRNGTADIGPKQLRGTYDEFNRTVFWSIYDEDRKPFFVTLSLEKGISGMMPFRTHDGVRRQSIDTITGEITDIDYFETHSTLYSEDYQRFYRGQGRHLLYADDDQLYDETNVANLKIPIVPLLKSVAFGFDAPWTRKITNGVMLNLRDVNSYGVSMTPLGWNDLSELPHELANCLNFQHLPFALDYATSNPLDLQQFFKHTDCQWKSEHLVSYKRSFPKGRRRNVYKQFGFTGLRYRYGEISSTSAGIVDLQAVLKADFPEATAFIEITVSNPSVNVVQALSLDVSGQFFLSWEYQQAPVQIQDISQVGNVYTLKVLMDSDNIENLSDVVYRWPTISFYRLFTDQKINMIGYNLTYRIAGDRTQGILKSVAKGGVDA